MVYFGGFFVKLGNFAGFSLYYFINNAVRISEAAMGGAGGDIIFITSEPSRRIHPYTMIFCVVFSLYYSPKGFFPKLEFLFKLLILPKETAKLRWENIFFRVQRSSIRVQRSSVGCSVSQKGKA